MSGHSKWHNIQGRKGKQDTLRANQFTKIGRMITIAVRESGSDPTMNMSLRLAISKAKEVNMPKDNIEKAMKRGTGELSDGAHLEELIYEGFGPGGIAFLVEAVTDSKNRTAGDMKHLFGKYGGALAAPGSVQWQFEHRAVVRISSEELEKIKIKKEELELALMDAGAEDIRESEFGWEILGSIKQLHALQEVAVQFGVAIEESGLEWIAKETVTLDVSLSESVGKLYDALDELDDVKAVYVNVL